MRPWCSPTRTAFLTGRYQQRVGGLECAIGIGGVGRYDDAIRLAAQGQLGLPASEITIARLLRDGGYATALSGKWHLGDNYPYRPQDRGFTEVYYHGGGGVGQTPDLWDNAYFDGRYFHNGRVVAAKGFCTDVFFAEAHRFIREQAAAKKPFLAYISLNAPHSPFHAPQNYLDRYPGQTPELAAFFGMITNIDDNVGTTRALLRELGIADNTLFIFTTDNGTATGEKIFNAGMRGKKGSEYEGGHRVPLLAHWPAAGWTKPHVNDTLSHAVDIVPTLLDVTGAPTPAGLTFDGRSIRPLLDPAANTAAWPHERMLVTDSQRVRDPVKWKQTAVMSGPWRLINNTELYDLRTDRAEQHDLSAKMPEKAKELADLWQKQTDEYVALAKLTLAGQPKGKAKKKGR